MRIPMRKYAACTLLFIFMITIAACQRTSDSQKTKANYFPAETDTFRNKKNIENNKEEIPQKENAEMKMKLEVGDYVFMAVLEENSSVEALKELLVDGPLTLTMTDYAGMEKSTDLGTVLPQNNVQMNTQAGDIVLYQGRTFVIYYDTNSWSLTPIGKIENVDTTNLQQALGTGTITVNVSIE